MMKRTFVDRIEELRHLNKVLKYDGTVKPVLVFTGIGGMGKTALRIAFEEEILKPKKIPYAVLDYDADPNLRPIEASLRAVRRQLGRHKVKTPVFDFLYARYFELSTGLKLSRKNFPLELEGVVNILEAIPGVSNVTQVLHGLSQLGLVTKERLQHKEWLYRIRDLEPREVLNLLPEVLADDLEEAMSLQSTKILKSPGCRVVLLVDAYELISESQLDDTLHRKLLLFTPHLLRVIFTRTPLPWEHKFPKEWRGEITHFPALDNLSKEDTLIFLRKKGIDSADLQNHLCELTGGYPMHLELCTDICREIAETTQRRAEISDFRGATQAKDLTKELVSRLLKQLKDDERDLMCLAAYPRWVSEEVLDVLSSVPESVPRIFEKFTSLSMFSPHAEISNAYVIRKEVRDCLMLQQKKERLFKLRHGKISQFHRERWEETHSYHYFREALYHGFYEDSEQAIEMFEEHFWKVLDKFSFGEAEGLLDAVPVDTLSEKQKRKIDYARARLLIATAHAQESLITAKHIYEALIVAETDEVSLGEFYLHLGSLLCDIGEYVEALECHEKALAIRLKVCGEEHPTIALSYKNIGNVYLNKGEYEKALEYLQKSLAIRLKVYGEEHPTIADSYNNIGVVYLHTGEYEKALEYLQKALTIWLQVRGKEHPDVATSYNNIGAVYWNKGEYDKALECHEKALAIRLKVYGKKHPDVATSYNNIGVVYSKQGEYGKAHDYLQKALAIELHVGGKEHPHVATSYNNIGNVYRSKGEYEKALEYLQKSLAIRLKVYGEKHPDVAESHNGIARTLRALKRDDEALGKMRKSVEISRKFKLWNKVAEGLDTLSEWLREMGRKAEADEARAEAKKIRKDH